MRYSESIKDLLQRMLCESEQDRPKMETIMQHAISQLIPQAIQNAVFSRETGNYERALEELRSCETLLGVRSAELCLELGRLYSHFGQWVEAVTVLTQGLQLPSSQFTLQLNNVLAETYYQKGQYKECISQCELILATGIHSGSIFELQKALYYLSNSHYSLGDELGVRSVIEWKQVLVSDSPKTRCLTLLIEADRMHFEDNKRQAVVKYARGLEVALQELPNSLCTACSMRELGRLYEDLGDLVKAEALYVQCRDLCQIHFPSSFPLAKCFYNLAMLYMQTNRGEKAATLYLEGIYLLQTHFPYSEILPYCLYNLGILHVKKNRGEKAEEVLLEAEKLLRTHFPRSETLPKCLIALAVLYVKTNTLEKAEALYLQGIELLRIHFPHSEALSTFLMGLGLLHKGQGRKAEASESVKEAAELYSFLGLYEKVDECKRLLSSLV